jgi:transcriptional regulator with XRE-family HTH domain
MTKFGYTLKRMRQLRQVSQRDLAKQIGVDWTYISKIESGHLDPPSLKVIHKIAQTLGVQDESDLINLAGRVPDGLKDMMYDNPLLTELVRVLSEKKLSEDTYYQMTLIAQGLLKIT